MVTPDLESDDEGVLCTNELSLNASDIHNFCRKEGITENNLFLSATILALSKFTFTRDLLISTVSTGRTNPKYRNTIGMLVKTLPIMVGSENRNMMVEDFIKIVDKSWKDALVHSNYPYTTLSEEYQLKPEFFYAYHGAFGCDLFAQRTLLER